ncbi:MAG: hypothetical protein A2Y77_04245 [Planctomycetes bacterium RBG_13_62_9]|nr:MAG: hypothetical protein A2Y77_04245 [Planctomycetes bacterium RBG_13_62_9]
MAGKPGLVLWNEPAPLGQLATDDPAGVQLASAGPSGRQPAPSDLFKPQPQPVILAPRSAAPEPKVPWTPGSDLDKYRAYAVKRGSRNSGESLKKAFERAGMTLGDGVNVFVLGYASERAKPFRENDGKGIFQEPGKVPARAGSTVVSLGDGVYSILDVAMLNALPDPNKSVYRDNHPIIRPLIFTGRTIGGVWKTTEEVGNAVTWGLFDNVTGCLGLVIEDIFEFLKHTGQAVTNVARAPIRLIAGKKKEGADRAMDWVLLVPLEFASNAVTMKGISNMDDYETAFAEKGVIGSLLEFGGSTFLVYRAVDELADEIKKDNKRGRRQGQTGQQGGQTPENPPQPPTPPPVEPPAPVEVPSDIWIFWGDGYYRTYPNPLPVQL